MKDMFGFDNKPATIVGQLVEGLQHNVKDSQMVSAASTKSAISIESLNDSQRHGLTSTIQGLSTAIESIATELGLGAKMTEAQKRAGVIGGLMAGDYRSALTHKGSPMVATENAVIVQGFDSGDSLSERSFSLEAYDERENRNAVVYSIAYNMQAARQDEFGETFFPTLVLTPDQVGFGVSVNLMQVYDAVERKISGSVTDFKRKNIIRAVVDHTILKKEQTRVVPVHRAQSAANFVDGALVAASDVSIEGETIHTAPIAVGKKVDLLGLSQTDALVAAGLMDMTDSLDPYIQLSNVYVKVGADVLKFPTLNVPMSNFTYSTQNNQSLMTMNFVSNSLLVNKNTKAVDGSALADLAAIVTGDLVVRLEINMSGTVNIQTGETQVFGNGVAVYTVQDAAGVQQDLGSGAAKAIADLIAADGSVIGYDIQAYRTNMNRRQRGQLIDVTKFTQLYNVPLRSPITTIHPINTDGATDASDVQALITATRIRVSNEAVTALLNAASLLGAYVDARDELGNGPDVLGVGRWFVKATYFKEAVNVSASIDSIKSHERAQDMQSVLINKLRDHAYRMYRDSEYKAAADALQGGNSATPVVIIGTDPVLARYINLTGDLRTLGGEFDVRIVTTLDKRVAGKIFMTFGVFDESRNTTPNPLNFGNMIWGPELVLTANISRGNTTSKETVVQPRYAFVTHMPVMTEIDVTGVKESLGKVAVNFHDVP